MNESLDLVLFFVGLGVVVLVIGFISGLINFIYGWKLMNYIKRNDNYKYQYLWGNAARAFGVHLTLSPELIK
jgi:hypothetical protein